MNLHKLKEAKERMAERKVGEETVLVPLSGNVADLNEMFTLNEVGSLIWENLTENTSLQSLTDSVTATFDVSENEAEEDIRAFLSELETYLESA